MMAIVNGKSGSSGPEMIKEPKVAGKARASQVYAIEKVIEERINGPIRDLTLKNQRLEKSRRRRMRC